MNAARDVLAIRAGARALARIRSHGLDPAEVALIPAAAGGPKGLALIGLDRAIFGEWLPRAPRRRWLIGASVGAWRMAAACLPDPVAALDRLALLYCDEQEYRCRPSPAEVTRVCTGLVDKLIGNDAGAVLHHAQYKLAVLTVRGRGPLARAHRAAALGWGFAAVANSLGRGHLSGFLERGVFTTDVASLPFFRTRFDAFDNQVIPITAANLNSALLASGSIPLILEGVTAIADAPQGTYWDGGIIDYHLALPYPQVDGLVLYPHFAESVTPGWLDKPFPGRRANAASLDNVMLVGPSRNFIARLPGGNLPDRSDFRRYRTDPAMRSNLWKQAITEGARVGDAFLRWAEVPDLSMLRGFDE